MFNTEFYPTPKAVIETMLYGVELNNKVVLEPSAGKGDIVDYCKDKGAKVLCCELNNDLATIVSKKAKFLKNDFFTVESFEISHVDLIVMNPPFSNADKHIQWAYEIAPEGCEIIALCNSETIKNSYSTSRKTLLELTQKFGSSFDIGEAFDTAERKTNVSVAIVKLKKPKSGSDEFEGYFSLEDDGDGLGETDTGLMKHNEIVEIVNRYVGAVKMFDEVMTKNKEINNMFAPIVQSSFNIKFGVFNSRDKYNSEIDRDTFKKELQKGAWQTIFDKMKMQKFVTSKVMAEINKFVEQQSNVPLTIRNVYKMLEMIAGTHSSRMETVLLETFDRICNLSAKNNSAGEKWVTNKHYYINKTFIHPYICKYEENYSWSDNYVKINYQRVDEINDIIKALCYVTGKNYDLIIKETVQVDGKDTERCKDLNSFFHYNKIAWGQWVEWNEFFDVKGFKKGTMHFKFKDEKVWHLFNQRVSKIKGFVLPTDMK